MANFKKEDSFQEVPSFLSFITISVFSLREAYYSKATGSLDAGEKPCI